MGHSSRMKTKCCSDSACGKKPAVTFICLMGKLLGIWLLYIGIVKWVGGPDQFVGYIGTQFANTFSPAPLNTLLGWLIIIAEPVIGLWLIVGCSPCLAWLSTTLLFFALTMGQTILGSQNVSDNWNYTILSAVCFAIAASRKKEGCCADTAAVESGCCAEKTPTSTGGACCSSK